MEEKPKKKLHLTKKQFIIAIAAVCGIALIIEAVLLVKMFTKKEPAKENVPTSESEPTETQAETTPGAGPGSYLRIIYYTKDGERLLVDKREVLMNEAGKVSRCNSLCEHGITYPYNAATEETYQYDGLGRVTDWFSVTTNLDNNNSKTTSEIAYEYRDDPSTVITTFSAMGKVYRIEETRYDENGIAVSWKESDGEGYVVSVTSIEYDQYYNVKGYSKTEGSQRKTVTLYPSGRKTVWTDGELGDRVECYYDSQWRLIRKDEYGRVGSEKEALKQTTQYVYSETGRTPDTAQVFVNGELHEEAEFDAQGRIVKRTIGENQVIYIEWDLEDPAVPGRKVRKTTTYLKQYGSAEEDLKAIEERYCLTDYCEEITYDENGIITGPSCYSPGAYESSTVYYVEGGHWDLSEYRRNILVGDEVVWDTEKDTTFTFDEAGNLRARVELSNGLLSTVEYDDRGNMTKRFVSDPDGLYEDVDDSIWEYEYIYY